MKLDMKEVLKPAALLCAICLLVTALLVGTNMMTEGKIAQNAVEKAEATRSVVLPAATDFELEEDCAVGYANGEIVDSISLLSAASEETSAGMQVCKQTTNTAFENLGRFSRKVEGAFGELQQLKETAGA